MPSNHQRPNLPAQRSRARELISRTRSTFRYIVVSPKNGTEIHCESTLEKKFVHLLEFSRGVISYTEQPERVVIDDGGEAKVHFPDFALEMADGSTTIVEVKDRRRLREADVVKGLSLAKAFYAQRGIDYLIYTDELLDQRRRTLKNMAHLKRFKTSDTDVLQRLGKLIPDQAMPFHCLIDHLDVHSAWELVANQLVYCDLTVQITENSIIRPMQDGDHERLY